MKRAVFYPSAQLRNPHITTTAEPTNDSLGPSYRLATDRRVIDHDYYDKKEEAKILQGDSGLVIDTSGLEDSLSRKDQSYENFNEIGDYFITVDPEEQLVDVTLSAKSPSPIRNKV